MWQAEVRVDLDAIRDNVALLRAGTTAEVMVVVKADAYGHGMRPVARAGVGGGGARAYGTVMLPVARAALESGASWLGVCTLDEALTLRRAGITAPVLAW